MSDEEYPKPKVKPLGNRFGFVPLFNPQIQQELDAKRKNGVLPKRNEYQITAQELPPPPPPQTYFDDQNDNSFVYQSQSQPPQDENSVPDNFSYPSYQPYQEPQYDNNYNYGGALEDLSVDELAEAYQQKLQLQYVYEENYVDSQMPPYGYQPDGYYSQDPPYQYDGAAGGQAPLTALPQRYYSQQQDDYNEGYYLHVQQSYMPYPNNYSEYEYQPSMPREMPIPPQKIRKPKQSTEEIRKKEKSSKKKTKPKERIPVISEPSSESEEDEEASKSSTEIEEENFSTRKDAESSQRSKWTQKSIKVEKPSCLNSEVQKTVFKNEIKEEANCTPSKSETFEEELNTFDTDDDDDMLNEAKALSKLIYSKNHISLQSIITDVNQLNKLGKFDKISKSTTDYEIIKNYFENSCCPGNSKFIANVSSIYELSQTSKSSLGETLLWFKTSPTSVSALVSESSGCAAFYDRSVRAIAAKLSEIRVPFNQLLLLCSVSLGKVEKSLDGFHFWNKKGKEELKFKQGYDTVKGVGCYIPDWEDSTEINGILVPCGKTKENNPSLYSTLKYNEYVIFERSKVQVRYAVDVDIIPTAILNE